jgi:APA family basic amino acid/polyamine antiporter
MGSQPAKLSFPVILLITINSIMGTGIFFLPAVGARQAGLFAIISWAIMGLIAIYFGAIFGELVSRYPKEGGVYEYAKEAFGFFPSFLLGWMTLIAANVTIAMLMVGAVKYVGPALPNYLLSIISILFVLVFNYIAFKGLRTGKFMLLAFAGITLTAVLGILIPGLLFFNPENFTGWLLHEGFASLDFSLAGIFVGSTIVIGTIFFIAETFFGWETATFLAEEVDNPKKTMPRSMVVGTVIIGILSLLFVIASKSVMHWTQLAMSSTPLSDLASVIYGPGIVPYYSILVYLAIIGSVAGWIVAAPNLLVALAKDKLFITSFAKKHPKTNTPYRAIIFQTILTSAIVLIGAGNYETLLHLLVPVVIILYTSVVLSLLFIRKKQPVFDGYVAPGGNWGPVLLMLFTLSLLVIWALQSHDALFTLGVVASLILLGLPVFLLMNFLYNTKAVVTFQDKTANLNYFFERLFLPARIRRRLLVGTKPHQEVLFLGAGSGILIHECEARNENIIIVEHSLQLVHRLQKRFPEAKVIHDENLTSRVHPEIQSAHVVISVGILSNIHDLRMYLNHLKHVLPEHAVIRLFDYVDFYKILPNAELLSDLEELKDIFKQNGFAIRIEKMKGVLWNYLIIEGIRTDKDVMYI